MRTRAITLLAAAIMMMAVPAQADPPEVAELNLIHVRGDVEHEIVVFWNTTRNELCDWVDGGFIGPRPIDELLPVRFQETGNGAVTAHIRAERVMEIWYMADPDAPDPCTATAGESGPLASGNGLLVLTDNDFDVSGTRLNAFGTTIQARLAGQDGSTWHYNWVFRGFIDLSGDFSQRISFQFFQTGN
jgi:hypothetical protein